MPSPTSALDLITRSMKLAKLISGLEVPKADEAQDALATLNDILENWDTEPLSLWAQSNLTVSTVAGQATYTVGPGGNWAIDRPRNIDDAFVTFNGESYPLELVNQMTYNAIATPAQTSPYPEQLLYVPEVPLGRVTLFPVPTAALPITISAPRLISSIPTVATILTYPPGAAKALRYLLAIELGVEYGVPPDQIMVELAADAKADYKRVNKRTPILQCDDGLSAIGGWW